MSRKGAPCIGRVRLFARRCFQQACKQKVFSIGIASDVKATRDMAVSWQCDTGRVTGASDVKATGNVTGAGDGTAIVLLAMSQQLAMSWQNK